MNQKGVFTSFMDPSVSGGGSWEPDTRALGNYDCTVKEQGWVLSREKIGLGRKGAVIYAKKRQEQGNTLHLQYIWTHFSRLECVRFEAKRECSKTGKDVCYCGLRQEQHLKELYMHPNYRTVSKVPGFQPGHSNGLDNASLMGSAFQSHPLKRHSSLQLHPHTLTPVEERNCFTPSPPTSLGGGDDKGRLDGRRPRLPSLPILEAEGITVRRRDTLPSVYESESTAASNISDVLPEKVATEMKDLAKGMAGGDGEGANEPAGILKAGAEPPGGERGGTGKQSQWSAETCLLELPTNAYGKIDFMNETAGSTKPAKYLRLSHKTPMDSVLRFLVDYWHFTEPQHPYLAISVIGGAKNFRLDGKKQETFTSGLIRAVKSTGALLLTGGMNVGVMRSVGEAVNQGQYLVKMKRNRFGEEKETFTRGMKCLGVVPWGYVKGYDKLINRNPSRFARIRYKVEDKVLRHCNVSLNGDHTHFLLVDNGNRYSFDGSDDFRTQLETTIQAPEPLGLGTPVVVLLLEGGYNAVNKCAMALESNIPVVVVAGTGRASDVIAHAVSLTKSDSDNGEVFMRRGYRQLIEQRVRKLMPECTKEPDQFKRCVDRAVECCRRAHLITIFDIHSSDGMDKYILMALLTSGTHSSRIDQLKLALLWDRPDIAEMCESLFHMRPSFFRGQIQEGHIIHTFICVALKHDLPHTEMSECSDGCFDDLMTDALLRGSVEFTHLLLVNGLVMRDFLTVSKLRKLYNEGCEPSGHMANMLRRHGGANDGEYYLSHVNAVLQVFVRQHLDEVYAMDTPLAAEQDSTTNYLTFEDPYQELLLWSIFSRRHALATFLWERCDSPLIAAVVASSVYKALFDHLKARNTELREEFMEQKNIFEALAIELVDLCYKEDATNAMALVERRIPKWGNLDLLELSIQARNQRLLSTTCCQSCVQHNWKRGMTKAPTLSVLMSIFCPFLVWTSLFRFRQLGDSGGELNPFQKLFVFYRAPITKFYGSSISFITFLLLYAYVVLFDFNFHMSVVEMVLIVWIATMIIEEINEILGQRSSSLYLKLEDWWKSVWNRFDTVAFVLAVGAFGLRLTRTTFHWGRVAYAINTSVFYCRLFRIYHVSYRLGPKLVIFYRMVSEVLVFMALLIIFILAYGIASQSLLHPYPDMGFNATKLLHIVHDIILTPYWQMYGELSLDQLEGTNEDYCYKPPTPTTRVILDSGVKSGEDIICENPTHYTAAVKVMLVFYLIVGNIMLLNLLIAIFTYVFDEVHENSMEIWKFEMCSLLLECDHKLSLPPPLNVLEHLFLGLKSVWERCFRRKRVNWDDFLTGARLTLHMFEKQSTSSLLSNRHLQENSSQDKVVRAMAEKLDRVIKFIDTEEGLREMEDESVWMAQDDLEDDSDSETEDRVDENRPLKHVGQTEDEDLEDVISDLPKRPTSAWERTQERTTSALARSFRFGRANPSQSLHRHQSWNDSFAGSRQIQSRIHELDSRLNYLQMTLNEWNSKVEGSLEALLQEIRKKP